MTFDPDFPKCPHGVQIEFGCVQCTTPPDWACPANGQHRWEHHDAEPENDVAGGTRCAECSAELPRTCGCPDPTPQYIKLTESFRCRHCHRPMPVAVELDRDDVVAWLPGDETECDGCGTPVGIYLGEDADGYEHAYFTAPFSDGRRVLCEDCVPLTDWEAAKAKEEQS